MPSNTGLSVVQLRGGKLKQPFCFEVNNGELFDVRRTVGSLEGLKRAIGEVMLDTNDHPERSDRGVPRPDACHP